MTHLSQTFRLKDGQNPEHWLIAVANLFRYDPQLSEVVLVLGQSSKDLDQWIDGLGVSIQRECLVSEKNEDNVWHVKIRRPSESSLRDIDAEEGQYPIEVREGTAEIKPVPRRQRVYFYGDDNAAGRLVYGCNFNASAVSVETLSGGVTHRFGANDWLVVASPQGAAHVLRDGPRSVNIVVQEPIKLDRDFKQDRIPAGEKGARALGKRLGVEVAPASRRGTWLVALAVVSPLALVGVVAAHNLLPLRTQPHEPEVPPTPTTVASAPDAGAVINGADAGRESVLDCRPVTEHQWSALRSLNTYELRTSDRSPGVFTRGSRQRLASFLGDRGRAGRPTLIVIGATTCPPCMEELPLLGADARAHQNEPDGPQILALLLEDGWNVDTDPVPSMLTATAQRITWSGLRTIAVGAGPENDHERLLGDPPFLPAFLYVDRDGSPQQLCFGGMIDSSLAGKEYTRWLHRVSLRIPEG